jgi:beta-xylosidase
MSRRRQTRDALVVLVSALVLVGCAAQSGGHTGPSTQVSSQAGLAEAPTLPPLQVPTFPPTAPAWNADFPDPFVLLYRGVYYAYATEGTLDAKLQVLTSWDLMRWGRHGDALVDTPAWALPDATWAPALMPLDGHFLLYYSAQLRNSAIHCISVAIGDSPDGRFVDDSSGPLVCDPADGGAIDPRPFVDRDGTAYLLWKRDGASVGRPNEIYSQRLTATGLAVEGQPVRLIGADQPWEAGQVEAPSMALVGARYVLLYSGNWWNTDLYALGLALCDSPLGPCLKPNRQPILTSKKGALGPGGADMFSDVSGQLLVAYHAWTPSVGPPGHRSLWIARATDLGIAG